MAFYQKYRAKIFAEMVGQEHVVKTILQGIKSDRLVHAYLLTGPRGIGKTSTARLLSKAINCEEINASKKAGKESSGEPCNQCSSCTEINDSRSIDVIEIDAASHTGVEDVRELIENARLAPAKSAKKVYIIDEVHMLSKSAFNALLKTLEEPPSHVVFILATTEVHKIPATILSRAQRFDFKRATKEEIIANLKKIAQNELIDISPESLDLIAVSAAGGHRDAIGLLEQVSGTKGHISLEITRNILGIARDEEVIKFVGAIFNEIPEEGLKIAHELYKTGHDLNDFNKAVIELLRKILLLKVSGRALFEDTEERKKEIVSLASNLETDKILSTIKTFIEASSLLKDINYPVLPLEIAIVKASRPNQKPRIQNLVGQKEGVATPKEGKESASHRELNPSAAPQDDKKMLQDDSKKVSQDDKKISVVDSVVLEDPASVDNKTIERSDKDTAPVPVLEMTKDIWQQIIEETKKQNSTLAALLRDARPDEITNNTLTLAVKFKFHKDKISEPKNAAILEKIVCDITGCDYRLLCKISDEKPRLLAPKANPEDLEKAVGEVFEVE